MAAPAYDPTLYSSTGSWAGMPYDQQLSYGGAPAYPQQPAAPFPGSYGPGPGGPGWAPSGPPRMVSMQYEGAPPHDPYRGSLPPGFNDPYGYPGPYGPPPPRPPKVFGVRRCPPRVILPARDDPPACASRTPRLQTPGI